MSENDEMKNQTSAEEADADKNIDSSKQTNADEAKKEDLVKEDTENAEESKKEDSPETTEIPFTNSSAASQDSPKQEKWYCVKCGEENIGNFCYKCGAPKPQNSDGHEANKEPQKPQPGTPVPDTRNKKKKEHSSIFTKARVITCVIAMVLGLGAGYIGGKIAGKEVEEEIAQTMENVQENEQGPGSMGPGFDFEGGSSKDDDSNASNDSSAPFVKAAIGVTVEQDSSAGYSGCVISAFTNGSNAEDAGLEIGDIISEIDGQEMTSYADIREYLSTKEAGDTVEITVIRDGEEVTADVELINSGNQQ